MSESEPFVFPELHQGDVVLFSRSPEVEPTTMAMVAKVCSNNLHVLVIYASGSMRMFIGVRHRNDPWVKDHPDALEDGGVFVEGPQMVRLAALEKQVASLTEAIAQLAYGGPDTPAEQPNLESVVAPRRGRPPKPKPELVTVE